MTSTDGITLTIMVEERGIGLYDAFVGEERIVQASRQPLLDAARVLRDRGMDGHAWLCMSRRGTGAALCGRLGRLAEATVRETPQDGPRTVPYRAFAGR